MHVDEHKNEDSEVLCAIYLRVFNVAMLLGFFMRHYFHLIPRQLGLLACSALRSHTRL